MNDDDPIDHLVLRNDEIQYVLSVFNKKFKRGNIVVKEKKRERESNR